MEEMRKVGDEIAAFDADIAELEAAMDAFLMTLPNFPHESVPLGKDDHDNVEKRRWGDAARVRLDAEGALGHRHRSWHSGF